MDDVRPTRTGLKPGDPAPDFELPGTSEQAGVHREKPKSRYNLSSYRGRPVLLVFFSAAFTPT
jgi:peroxiredoxin